MAEERAQGWEGEVRGVMCVKFLIELYSYLPWHRPMRYNKITHVNFAGWRTRPRHCSQSVLTEPVERYYGRASLVYHLVVRTP